MSNGVASVLKVGDLFGSLQEVQDKVLAFEREARVNYYISDSRTIEKAMKNAPEQQQKHAKNFFTTMLCMHAFTGEGSSNLNLKEKGLIRG